MCGDKMSLWLKEMREENELTSQLAIKPPWTLLHYLLSFPCSWLTFIARGNAKMYDYI